MSQDCAIALQLGDRDSISRKRNVYVFFKDIRRYIEPLTVQTQYVNVLPKCYSEKEDNASVKSHWWAGRGGSRL